MLDSLDRIPEGSYEGYVWASDCETPVRVHSGMPVPPPPPAFVKEALLWDEEKRLSVHVCHDGNNRIACHDLGLPLPEGAVLQHVEYLAHRVPDAEKLRFTRYLETEFDPLCEGMEVLVLKATVFTGVKPFRKNA